jgi:hypothetical protein
LKPPEEEVNWMAKTKTAKKPAVKKTIKKAAPLPQAPPEHVFFLVDGRALRDYKELADSLEAMADHVYNHHVNQERNDFATWIADTLQDKALAHKISVAEGKHHMQIIIYRHILDRL